MVPTIGTCPSDLRHKPPHWFPGLAYFISPSLGPAPLKWHRHMCLLGIALRQFDDYPLLVLANREEFYARPTAGPRIFPRHGDSPAWLGGIDLQAGGTWLGVNELGLLVAVTNRQKTFPPAAPPSRGQLCRSLLRFRETASAADAARVELDANRYAGCNLLIADRTSATVIEAADTFQMHSLAPGLHLIANAELNSVNDRRIRRVRTEFDRANAATADEWFREARHLCQLPADGNEPPICLAGEGRGTVSSTVLGIGRDLQSSRYWYAPGPPNRTAYDDFTPHFRELFNFKPGGDGGNSVAADIEPPYDSPARRRVRESAVFEVKDGGGADTAGSANAPYRIFLRGPWECEPLARAERDAAGAISWSTTDLPAPSTVRLPASWQDLFGSFRGRARFRRRFHPPSNITSGERLYIVFDGLVGVATVSLNGRLLGNVAPPERSSNFDMTNLLEVNNELEVDLVFIDFAVDASPGGLFGPVALEIHVPR
jgi:uncharacterized protein with NRDE domain